MASAAAPAEGREQQTGQQPVKERPEAPRADAGDRRHSGKRPHPADSEDSSQPKGALRAVLDITQPRRALVNAPDLGTPLRGVSFAPAVPAPQRAPFTPCSLPPAGILRLAARRRALEPRQETRLAHGPTVRRRSPTTTRASCTVLHARQMRHRDAFALRPTEERGVVCCVVPLRHAVAEALSRD